MKDDDDEQLDLFMAGWAGAVDGLTRASDHAESDSPGWSQRAREALRAYLRAHPGSVFVAPTVRLWAERNGLQRPPTDRAWGAVFLAASRAGEIVHAGYCDYGDERMHTQAVKVWRPAA